MQTLIQKNQQLIPTFQRVSELPEKVSEQLTQITKSFFLDTARDGKDRSLVAIALGCVESAGYRGRRLAESLLSIFVDAGLLDIDSTVPILPGEEAARGRAYVISNVGQELVSGALTDQELNERLCNALIKRVLGKKSYSDFVAVAESCSENPQPQHSFPQFSKNITIFLRLGLITQDQNHRISLTQQGNILYYENKVRTQPAQQELTVSVAFSAGDITFKAGENVFYTPKEPQLLTVDLPPRLAIVRSSLDPDADFGVPREIMEQALAVLEADEAD